MTKLTGGEALVRALLPERIPFVFGLVGGKLAPFLRAVSLQPSMRFIGARHEGHAAMMASAVAAGSGQLGVVAAECGSGGGNLVPGIAMAKANNLPMFVLTSNNQHYASYPARGMFADMDTESLFRPITKWNTAVHDGRRIPELVRWGLREAFTGRPGPVHLDVPQDILRGTFDYDESEFGNPPARYRMTVGAPPCAGDIARARDLLMGAKRPLLLAGGGVTAAGATEAFRRLAHGLGAPAIATQMGNGNIAADDPLFLGMAWVCGGDAVHRACADADVVLAVGCRFSSWMRGDRGTLLNTEAQVIHVDVDPAVIGQHVPVAVGICADAKLALEALLAAMPAGPAAGPGWAVWREALLRAFQGYRTRLDALAARRGGMMHPAALSKELSRLLPRDALAVFDGGHTSFWSNDFLPAPEPRSRFNEPGMTQLGFGLPWAMTLQLLHPGKPVFNVTGDGAFGFSLQELDTARRYGLPVINVIHNNASWGIIKLAYEKGGFDFASGNDFGTSLEGTRYADIARGFDCHGEVVETVEALQPALERAIGSGKPAVIDCRVLFEPHPCMPFFSRMSAAGAG